MKLFSTVKILPLRLVEEQGASMFIDTLNLAVSSGRSSFAGLDGLTTRIVLQFLSPHDLESNAFKVAFQFFSFCKRFVCDNVLNYEIVLPSGTILNFNRQNHSNLMKALRQGSNSFWIITRFDLHTFPQGRLWGGGVVYDQSVRPQMLSAFVEFGRREH